MPVFIKEYLPLEQQSFLPGCLEARAKQGPRSVQLYRELQLRLGRVQHAPGDVQWSHGGGGGGRGVCHGECCLCLAQSWSCHPRTPGLSQSQWECADTALVSELPSHTEESSVYREATLEISFILIGFFISIFKWKYFNYFDQMSQGWRQGEYFQYPGPSSLHQNWGPSPSWPWPTSTRTPTSWPGTSSCWTFRTDSVRLISSWRRYSIGIILFQYFLANFSLLTHFYILSNPGSCISVHWLHKKQRSSKI